MDNSSQNSPLLTHTGTVDYVQLVPKPLYTVPPKKTVFVSRLSNDTTPNDIDHYIKSKLGAKHLDIKIQFFSTKVNFYI